MSGAAETSTTILAGLDADDYTTGAAAIVDANARIAASGAGVVAAGDQVVASTTRATRSITDSGAGYERFLKQMDPAYAASVRFAAVQDMLQRSVDAGRVTQATANTQLDQFAGKLASTGAAGNGFNITTQQSSFVMRSLARDAVASFTALASGAPIMSVLASEGAALGTQMLLSARGFTLMRQQFGNFVTSMGGGWSVAGVAALAAVAVGIVALGAYAESSQRKVLAMQTTMMATRTDYVAAGAQATSAAQNVSSSSSMTTANALGAASAIGGSPDWQGTTAQLQDFIVLAGNVAKVMGTTVPDAAKKFIAEGFEDPGKAADELAKVHLPGFTDALAATIAKLDLTGQHSEALRLYFTTLDAATSHVPDQLTPMQKALKALGDEFDTASGQGNGFVKVLGGWLDLHVTASIGLLTALLDQANNLAGTGLPQIPANIQARLDAAKGPAPFGATQPGANTSWFAGGATLPAAPAATTPGTVSAADLTALVTQIASTSVANNLDPAFMTALQQSENAPKNGVWPPSGTGPIGAFQVAPSTYRADSTDASMPTSPAAGSDQTNQSNNVSAAGALMGHLLTKYGNVSDAVLAWHLGEGMVDDYLKGIALPATQAVSQANAQVATVKAAYGGTGRPTGAAAAPGTSAVGADAATALAGTSATNVATDNAAVKASTDASLAGQRAAMQTKIDQSQASADADAKTGDTAGIVQAVAATADYTRQLGLLVSAQEKAGQAADAEVAGLQGVGAAAREDAAIRARAAEQAKSDPSGLDTVALDKELAAAQAKRSASLDELIAKQQAAAITAQSANKTTEEGAVAAQHATNENKANADVLAKMPATNAAFAATVATLTKAYNDQTDAVRTQAQAMAEQRTADTGALIAKETDLIGQTTLARNVGIDTLKYYQSQGLATGAALDASQARNLAGIVANDNAEDAYAKKVAASAEITSTFGSALDSIGTSIAQSLIPAKGQVVDWGNTMTMVAQQVLDSFLKLAVINPLINSLFPSTNATTLPSSSGSGGGILGLLGGLFSSGSAVSDSAAASAASYQAGAFSTAGLGAMGPFQALGGVFAGPGISAYEGSVVSRPTQFRFAAGGSIGTMGEAGDEAILPLKRGPDGKLGVSAGSMGGQPPITMHIYGVRDPDTFRRSAPQILRATLAQQQRSAARTGGK